MLVEDACERPLFASPEAVAAAVAYVDARLSLLTASAALADRDPSYQPVFERLRRGLEADRYGLVAHVLMTRGVQRRRLGVTAAAAATPRASWPIVKSRVFEASIGACARLAGQRLWRDGDGIRACAPWQPPAQGCGHRAVVGPPPTGAPGSAKLDFPPPLIPAVSIMNPASSDVAEPRPTPLKAPPAAALPPDCPRDRGQPRRHLRRHSGHRSRRHRRHRTCDGGAGSRCAARVRRGTTRTPPFAKQWLTGLFAGTAAPGDANPPGHVDFSSDRQPR